MVSPCGDRVYRSDSNTRLVHRAEMPNRMPYVKILPKIRAKNTCHQRKNTQKYVPPTLQKNSMQISECRRSGYSAGNREGIHMPKGHWIRFTNSKRCWGQNRAGKSIPMRNALQA
jgi:hypothetical protein